MSVGVSPHQFHPLPGAKDLCRHCFEPKDAHPTESYTDARDVGNYAERADDPRRTRWGYRLHMLRVAFTNALDWLP